MVVPTGAPTAVSTGTTLARGLSLLAQLAWMTTNHAVGEAVLRGLRHSLLPDAAAPLTAVVRRGLAPTANRSSP